jgi:hypothetical protein
MMNEQYLSVLQASARTVSKEEGQNLALSKGALFKEVSAKRNEGVEEVFEQLVDAVRQRTA